ncbi:hypothetical protein CRG98_006547 [Punica granatum]|uniref:Uncharacterized protein n=1 Tax=Punica granatum TaxID=22663 RepID=A0A2I0KX52_PUNGR|nr:hypothetical protein CRG98_006547 [Punica granatum]
MWTLVGARMRPFGSRGLGVSTFPWGCVTDTREKESPLIVLRPEGRGRISYPGSRGMEHLVVVKNVIPCLAIREKSRRSVQDSGDSVERLEGCSGAKDARSVKMGAQEDVRRAGVCGSARGAGACGSGGARASASARRTRRRAWQRAATGALFTREHVLHPE